MSVLLIFGPKCTLAASHAVPSRVTMSMPMAQTDRKTDATPLYPYARMLQIAADDLSAAIREGSVLYAYCITV